MIFNQIWLGPLPHTKVFKFLETANRNILLCLGKFFQGDFSVLIVSQNLSLLIYSLLKDSGIFELLMHPKQAPLVLWPVHSGVPRPIRESQFRKVNLIQLCIHHTKSLHQFSRTNYFVQFIAMKWWRYLSAIIDDYRCRDNSSLGRKNLHHCTILKGCCSKIPICALLQEHAGNSLAVLLN